MQYPALLKGPILRLPSEDIQADLLDALDYDPKTGNFRWLENRRRVAEGDLAGTIGRDGSIIIGYKRKVYVAAHIAWLFTHNHWPLSYVMYRDHDPMNLAADNLYLREERYGRNSKALYMKDYRAKQRATRQATAPKSNRPNVTFTGSPKDGGAWCVRDPRDPRLVIVTLKDKKEAEAYADMLDYGRNFCMLNPPAKFPLLFGRVRAGGPKALTLQELSNRFAYDPETGAIFRRERDDYLDGERKINLEGTPAIIIDGTRRPTVRTHSRSYSAGMLAWFLHTGDWPRRKQIGYRDGKPKNTRFDNLYLKDEK